MEFINTCISAAELCSKHSISDHISRLERRVPARRQVALLNKREDKSCAKEVENLKCIIGEITIANDILKKTLEGTKR